MYILRFLTTGPLEEWEMIVQEDERVRIDSHAIFEDFGMDVAMVLAMVKLIIRARLHLSGVRLRIDRVCIHIACIGRCAETSILLNSS